MDLYPESKGNPTTEQYKKGHMIAILYPHHHCFLDITACIRQVDIQSIQVNLQRRQQTSTDIVEYFTSFSGSPQIERYSIRTASMLLDVWDNGKVVEVRSVQNASVLRQGAPQVFKSSLIYWKNALPESRLDAAQLQADCAGLNLVDHFWWRIGILWGLSSIPSFSGILAFVMYILMLQFLLTC